MTGAITTSLLGAFQAAFSVLLTLSYGVIAARLQLVNPSSAKDISQLCVNMFLPALLITNIGSQISTENFTNYIPVFIWAILYSLVSVAIGWPLQKLLKLPSWTVPAVCFNNTTSLPLLLTQALASTGVLESITGPDVSAAVERANSYFLINSMLSNAATLAIGPKLLDTPEPDSDSDSDDNDDNNNHADDADETTSLLPPPVATKVTRAQDWSTTQYSRLPPRLQSLLSSTASLLNPTLFSAFTAIFIGLCPPLQRALFARMENGGWLRAWFTSSLKNIGSLFTSLQMFVVGSKLHSSLGSRDSRVPVPAVAVIFTIRFLFWGAVSTPLIYLLATRTTLLGSDPVLWFAMCLMPVGPPAMILSALTDVAGCDKGQKMQVARLLTYMYLVTPAMFLPVVFALRACERAVRVRGEAAGL